MRIAVTDLTRMYDGHICVAGIDLATNQHVRPVIDGRLAADLLCSHGGPFDIGRIVELGPCRSAGSRPEVEDVRFDPRRCRAIESLSAHLFADLLRSRARSLDVIGTELARHGNSLATPEGRGACSLVIVLTEDRPLITINNYRRLRLRWREGVWLSVTDVRLYKDDLETPDAEKLATLQRALGAAREFFLSFGLARAWQQPGDDRARHYLQLNNVHVASWTDWQLCPQNR